MATKLQRLKKELSLPYVFAIATGTTLSSGFFLLPGIAAAEAGQAMVLSYLIAALPLIPAILCISELSTAMPRAGGTYYFIDRSIGPLFGTISGLGTWLALILKTAFALIGMGAYVALLLPNVQLIPISIAFAVIFGLVNIFGAKQSGNFQIYMVVILLAILVLFISNGVMDIEAVNYEGFFDSGVHSVLSTAGLVYISYVGVTNVASVAEEVKDPERNLPLGIMLAMGTSVLIYTCGTLVIAGVVPLPELAGNLTSVATAGMNILGKPGLILLSIAAIIAFFSVANSGILTASRYPMAMSRDQLAPRCFSLLNRFHTPSYAVILTVVSVVLTILFLNPLWIAKLASAFQLLMLSLLSLAVIVMRESQIHSYDPGYRSPLYPWLHVFGIVSPLLLISEMGMPIIASAMGMMLLGAIWFISYARGKTSRTGAVYHIFARLGKMKFEGLDSELRGILKEKGLREHDPFDIVVSKADVVDITTPARFPEVVREAAITLSAKLLVPVNQLFNGFMEGTKVGATPVSHGVALPHLRLHGIASPELLMVRTSRGVVLEEGLVPTDGGVDTGPIFAFFFFVSPDDDPALHLRILAKIADRVDDDDFMHEWLGDKGPQDLKEIMHRDERFISVTVREGTGAFDLAGKKIRDVNMPEGSLITMIHRGGKLIVPRGNTVINPGDRLTIIGEIRGIKELKKRYPV